MRDLLNDNRFDFVVISTIRPEILKLTLESFRPLFDQFPNRRLILNVDPVGEIGFSQAQIVDICSSFFSDVISRTPENGGFSEAVFWAWSQVESEIFFHLEDDWCLRRSFDAGAALNMMAISDVVSVRLNIKKNDKILSDGVSLNPSFFRKEFIKLLLDKFDVNMDPEKQFRPLPEEFCKARFLYFGSLGDPSLVIDTGKRWRGAAGFLKWNSRMTGKVIWSNGMVGGVWARMKYKFFLRYWRFRYLQGQSFI